MPTDQKSCTDCGAAVQVELPEGDIARRLASLLGVLCEPCAVRDQERAEREEQDEIAARIHRRVEAAQIPSRFVGVTLDDFDLGEPGRADAITAARAWAAGSSKPGLVLSGPIGTGKTRVAAAAAQAALHWSRRALRWVSVPVLIAKASSFGDAEKREATELLTSGRTALVLDDLDKVKASDWVASQLFAAIDSRVAANAPLFVTTNLRLDEVGRKFGGEFGGAIVSRLLEHCVVRELGGRDRRMSP